MGNRYKKIAIVGGGPAGLITALYLAKLPDTHISVYEKTSENDYKSSVCAEGISIRSLDKLKTDTGFCSSKFIAHDVKGIKVIFPNNTSAVYYQPGATLDRLKWQKALIQKARDRGVEIKFGTRVSDINELDADYIIGADGPASRVRKAMGGSVDMVPACQYQMTIERPVDCFEFYFHDIFHGAGKAKAGYGWVFPKGKFCNVGVKGTFQQLDEFLEIYNIKGRIHKKMGAPIPINGTLFEKDNFFLAGDAAGLVNPLTFGGMAPIVYCSGYLYQAIQNGDSGVYSELVRQNRFAPLHWRTKHDLFYPSGTIMNKIGSICDQCTIFPPSKKLLSRLAMHPELWVYILRLVFHLRRIKRVSW